MWQKRFTDEQIASAYSECGSIHKAAKTLGLNHSSVHERLVKMGINKPVNAFTQEDEDRLKREYKVYRDAGKLDVLAQEMGRTKQYICRKAGQMGLTDQRHSKPYHTIWKDMPKEVAKPLLKKLQRSNLSTAQFCKKHGYGLVQFSSRMAELFPGEWEAITELKRTGSQYRRGRAFEYRVRDRFKAKGYEVLRAAGSKGPADLVAFKKGSIIFIQCKIGHFHQVDEWNSLVDIAESVGATPVYATRDEHSNHRYWIMKRKNRSRKSVLDEEFEL